MKLEVISDEVRSNEVRSLEVRKNEVRSMEVRSIEVRSPSRASIIWWSKLLNVETSANIANSDNKVSNK